MSGDVTPGGLARIQLALGLANSTPVDSSAVAHTLTAAQMGGAGNVYLTLTGALAAGAALTLLDVQTLMKGIRNAKPGATYKLRIINASTGAFSWTVTTNTGWTLVNTMTIAQNTWRDFVINFTTSQTATLTSVGTGTNS